MVVSTAYSEVATAFTGDSWDKFEGGATVVCADDDIDNDNDGLIELCYLEDLDAIRYQLDGSGLQRTSTGTKVTTGCGMDNNGSCIGYELVRNLLSLPIQLN